MNDFIVASTNILRQPILTIKTLKHMLRISKLLKKEGYSRPLTKDIWTMHARAGFLIVHMEDGTRYTYNTRTSEFLD